MARRRKGYRVLGPYAHGRRYRIYLVGPDGSQELVSFESENEAEIAKKIYERTRPSGVTVEEVLEKYKRNLELSRQPRTVATTVHRIEAWLPDYSQSFSSITKRQMDRVYEQRVKTMAASTQRNELKEMKRFFRWAAKKKMIRTSPIEHIEPVGKMNKGKVQLRGEETAKFIKVALEQARQGEDSATACLIALLTGLRNHEVIQLKPRDVDVMKDRVLLWVAKSKTRNGVRQVRIKEPLSSLCISLKKKNKDWLFPRDNGSGHRPKEWLIRNCVRICKEAGVIRVTPHGLRGTWATLAIEQGAPIDLIAPILGHAGYQVTRDHYVAPGAEEQATTDRMMELCESEDEDED